MLYNSAYKLDMCQLIDAKDLVLNTINTIITLQYVYHMYTTNGLL